MNKWPPDLTDPDFAVVPADKADSLSRLWEAIKAKQQAAIFAPPPPPPEKIDPFVFASRIAAMQPTDRAWRLYQGVLFRVADVRSVYPNNTDGGFTLKLADSAHNLSLPIACEDPTRWFSEHVLGIGFQSPTT